MRFLKSFWAWLSASFTAPVFIGFLTVGGTLVRIEIQNKHDSLEKNLAIKSKVHNEVAVAMTDLRITRALIREKCTYYPELIDNRNELYEANKRRINAIAALIRAGYKAQSTFGETIGKQVRDLILKFDIWDLKFQNVCKQDDSIGEEYMHKEKEILAPMKQDIEKDVSRLTGL